MLQQFLNDISPKGSIEFSTIGADGCKTITKDVALTDKESNIYFLWWVRENLKGRAKDDDVDYVSYIRIDIDILNQADDLTTEEDVTEFAIPDIVERLKSHSILNTYSYIVFSWRGAHIYYCWEPISIDKKSWSLANDRIYREWDKLMPSEYCCDQATSNIGRIMRLPWSVNQKNWATCSIVHSAGGKSKLFTFVHRFAEAERKEDEARTKKRKEEHEAKMASYGSLDNDNNIYKLILEIPAYQIGQMLLPQFKFLNNGRSFSDGKWWTTAFFYSEEKNVIINGGSRHYNWWDNNSWFDSFLLVKKFYNWTSKETFEFFRKLIKKV